MYVIKFIRFIKIMDLYVKHVLLLVVVMIYNCFEVLTCKAYFIMYVLCSVYSYIIYFYVNWIF